MALFERSRSQRSAVTIGSSQLDFFLLVFLVKVCETSILVSPFFFLPTDLVSAEGLARVQALLAPRAASPHTDHLCADRFFGRKKASHCEPLRWED